MWRPYDVTCYQGASSRELVIEVIARSYQEAREKVRRWGYTPA